MHFKYLGVSVRCLLFASHFVGQSQRLIDKTLHFVSRETEAQQCSKESKFA